MLEEKRMKSSRNYADESNCNEDRAGVRAEARDEGQSIAPVPGQSSYTEHRRENMFRSPGYEVCEDLVRKLEPEYRRRYLSGQSSPEMKNQTKLVQELILSMVRQGPARDCIEEMAAKRSEHEPYDTIRVDDKMRLRRQEYDATGNIPAMKTCSSSKGADINAVFHEVCDLFAIANDDDSFAFICMLFDEDLASKFTTIAGPYMETYRTCNILHLTTIMRDVLEHAKWKCFGGQDASEHHKRETALIRILHVVRRARAAYGLTPYSTVRSRFDNHT